MNSKVYGIDIAKQVFQIYWVDEKTGEIHSDKVQRQKFLSYLQNQQSSQIAMEACGGAHHWGRRLQSMGHKVLLLPARKVKPFVTGNKNDMADAQAIWTAMQQPEMKYVAVKNKEQQAVLGLHRIREQLVKFSTAQINGLRGLLTEFGAVLPKGLPAFQKALPDAQAKLVNQVPQGKIMKPLAITGLTSF